MPIAYGLTTAIFPFTMHYLELYQRNRLLYRLVWISITLSIGLTIPIILMTLNEELYWKAEYYFPSLYYLVLLFNCPLMVVTGLVTWIRGNPNAKYYFLGMGTWQLLNVIMILKILSHNQIFEWFPWTKGETIGLLLFSFGLANQFKTLQEERARAEKQKALSDQLRDIEVKEKEKLKELDQFKTQLYTNITHEFRTPITVISGIADQMQNQPEEKELIQRNSQQLLDLVNQILELNKIESGHLKPQWVQTDIVPQIRYLTESYEHLARSQGKKFNLQILEDNLWMDTDPQMLDRILNNLVYNAIKFTPAGGEISLRMAKDQLLQSCLISISDTGKGIPADQIDKIFDRFYQIDSTNTRQGEGTGIGLALVKELTELLDGKVSVSSEINQGTKFMLKLPVRQNAEIKNWTPAAALDQTPEIGPANHATIVSKKDLPRILIIEDHPDVRIYLQRLLQNEYQLVEADNGKTGLSLAFEEIPDLIISDIMMPQMDGLTLCQQIKKDTRTSHIPVILLTAKSTQDDRLQGLEEGADAYLTKPFDKRELFIRIEKLLENREKLRSHYHQFQMLPQEKVQENSFLEKVRKHIEMNFSNELYQIEDLASPLHLSRTQIYRKLKALTGKTFTGIVKEMKIHRAKELLSRTDKTISEIAYELGFSDVSYFSKVFKEEMKLTPGRFRDKAF